MDADVLIDGYNVIKNNPMFRAVEVKNQAEARAVLIRQLKNRYRHSSQQVIVVFDGNGDREQVSHDDHIRIIFSRYGEKADDVIKRLAAQAKQLGRPVQLYSNDGEVRHNVRQEGGSTYTTGQLTKHLNAAPRDVAARAAHRIEMRKVYGVDPWYKAEDECDPQPLRHRKKKKKSSRRR